MFNSHVKLPQGNVETKHCQEPKQERMELADGFNQESQG